MTKDITIKSEYATGKPKAEAYPQSYIQMTRDEFIAYISKEKAYDRNQYAKKEK